MARCQDRLRTQVFVSFNGTMNMLVSSLHRKCTNLPEILQRYVKSSTHIKIKTLFYRHPPLLTVGWGTDYEVVDRDLGPFSVPGQRLCFNIPVNSACFFFLKMSSEDDHNVHISLPDTTVIIGTHREQCGKLSSTLYVQKVFLRNPLIYAAKHPHALTHVFVKWHD